MIKSLENLGNYGKHFTAEDWKEVEKFINENSSEIDRDFKTIKRAFKNYQKKIRGKTRDFLYEFSFSYFYETDVLGEFPENVKAQLENELRRHQKREKEILENGFKNAYDSFEHSIEDYLEKKLNLYLAINEKKEDI